MKKKMPVLYQVQDSMHKNVKCLDTLTVVSALGHVPRGEGAKAEEVSPWAMPCEEPDSGTWWGSSYAVPPASKYTEAACSLSILSHILNCGISVYCTLIR